MKKQPKFLSTRLTRAVMKTTINVFICACLAVSVVSLIVLTRDARKGALSALSNSILKIEEVITDVEASTSALSWVAVSVKGDASKLETLTKKLVETDSTILATAVAYEPYAGNPDSYYCMTRSFRSQKDGAIISGTMGNEDYDYHCLDWYQIPKLLGKPCWSDAYFDTEGSGKVIATYSHPLYDADGNFFGVLKSDISLEWLAGVMEQFKPYPSAVTILYGRNASVISHSRDKNSIMRETIFTDGLEEMEDNWVADKTIDLRKKVIDGESGTAFFPMEGQMIYAAYGPLKNGWSAVGLVYFRHFYTSARLINVILAIIALLGALLIFLTTRNSVRQISNPIVDFTYSAINMARGNFKTYIVDVDSRDEIKRLRDSLMMLQTTIKSYISELRSSTASNERFESELNIANGIQMAMLPRDFIHDDEIDLYAEVTPAREVGGDLYDFRKRDGKLCFAVGDVSGKGVPASMFMAITRSFFRFVSGLGFDMPTTISRINDSVCDGNDSGMFVTLFGAELDLATRELRFCNAGHNPLIVVTPDGRAEYLHPKANLAVGVFEGFPYEGESVMLGKGTRIIAYTDGVSEAENRSKELFGEERLISAAAAVPQDATSEEAVREILSKVREFTDGNEQNDDITLMSIRLL